MNRRGFLGSMLAACAAPAIVRADSLMRIVPMGTTVLSTVQFYDFSGFYSEQAIAQMNRALKVWQNEPLFIARVNAVYDAAFAGRA